MKTRIVFTRIWNDPFFSTLSDDGQKLYLWCLTNQYANLCGTYEASDRVILFETKLNPQRLAKAKQELLEKIVFYEGWVCIKQAQKQSVYKGVSTGKALERELSEIPESIVLGFSKVISYPPPTHPLPQVGGTNNNKYIINKENKRLLGEKEIRIFMETYNQSFKKNMVATESREDKLRKRREKFSLDQILRAVVNFSKSDFHRGKNDRKWVADPDFILRTDEIIDKGINLFAEKLSVENEYVIAEDSDYMPDTMAIRSSK